MLGEETVGVAVGVVVTVGLTVGVVVAVGVVVTVGLTVGVVVAVGVAVTVGLTVGVVVAVGVAVGVNVAVADGTGVDGVTTGDWIGRTRLGPVLRRPVSISTIASAATVPTTIAPPVATPAAKA